MRNLRHQKPAFRIAMLNRMLEREKRQQIDDLVKQAEDTRMSIQAHENRIERLSRPV